jgi:hypothetical protein
MEARQRKFKTNPPSLLDKDLLMEVHEVSRGFPDGKSPDGALQEGRKRKGKK